jgi:cell wall-associated NlpC family hydrolase
MTGGIGRSIAAGAAGIAALVVVIASAAGAALGANEAALDANPSVGPAIPAAYLDLYTQAAAVCPGLSWTTLAAIGTIESANGTSDLPGVHSGHNSAGAEGPMQFEPATFNRYDQPVPPGGANPPSPYDPTDAIYAAARDLCANGARNNTDLAAALYSYNHSPAYVAQVLAQGALYAQMFGTDSSSQAGAAVAVVAVAYAETQIGTPYRWGGETPGLAFDCSGLAQAAYHAAGIRLPRTAQAQYDTGPHLPPTVSLQPGDLVFFGANPTAVSHVGIYIGTDNSQTVMIDAPHTGAAVRVEPIPSTPGSPWGGDIFLGATRPAG